MIDEQNVDYDDLNDHLDDLAEEMMNGRTIRNSITIARQLAQFDQEQFSYKQLKDVIRVASKFDNYLKKVNQGFSDDQMAREGGLR